MGQEFRCVDATGRVTGVLIGEPGVVVKALSQDGGEGSSQADYTNIICFTTQQCVNYYACVTLSGTGHLLTLGGT